MGGKEREERSGAATSSRSAAPPLRSGPPGTPPRPTAGTQRRQELGSCRAPRRRAQRGSASRRRVLRGWSYEATFHEERTDEMQLKTLLNHVQKHKGFVYDSVRLKEGAGRG